MDTISVSIRWAKMHGLWNQYSSFFASYSQRTNVPLYKMTTRCHSFPANWTWRLHGKAIRQGSHIEQSLSNSDICLDGKCSPMKSSNLNMKQSTWSEAPQQYVTCWSTVKAADWPWCSKAGSNAHAPQLSDSLLCLNGHVIRAASSLSQEQLHRGGLNFSQKFLPFKCLFCVCETEQVPWRSSGLWSPCQWWPCFGRSLEE